MSSELDHFNDPLAIFRDWFQLAEASEPNDANAASLATATLGGVPSVRMVLTKGLDERGLRFFTNARSQKGVELSANPQAAVCFHWKTQRKQVRFAGSVQLLVSEETDTYFHSRSRGSQIAAAASHQSHPLGSREDLEASVRALTAEYEGKPVPLPTDWIGFLLVPDSIEFWMDGANRLHDRFLFTRQQTGWTTQRLYP